jgi:hypothetical protein
MRRFALVLLILLWGFFPHSALAAGTVTQTITIGSDGSYVDVTFTCEGDSGDGSIPITATANTDANGKRLNSVIRGMYLYSVSAVHVSGGTAPDAASVLVYDSGGMDLLGSPDGGTTPYAGLNLIHATLKKACVPYIYDTANDAYTKHFPMVRGALTLVVVDQGTASADYVVTLHFIPSERKVVK